MFVTAYPLDVVFAAVNAAPRVPQSDLPERLRAAIEDTHDAIERLPLSQAMVTARIDQTAYVQLLSQLWHVHRELECELLGRLPQHSFFEGLPARSLLVARDLDRLGVSRQPLLLPTVETLTALRNAAARQPWALLGAVYVLEGSRMGSMVLVKPLAQALKVPFMPGHGLDYHLEGMAQRPRDWATFKTMLRALPLTDQEADAAVQFAARFMKHLYAIFEAVPVAC